ncbi:MAG: two-component system, OmpR family, sensor kinase [Streptosporangiaceae bacterium]|nr:two-component system, OmpR family, sensor kinase [Streptosporangiaceae bacterium]
MRQDGWPQRTLLAWRPGRPSLRLRLAAVTVCLLAAGAALIVVASGLATRDHLTRQAAQQLRGYAGQLTRHPFLLTPQSRTTPGPPALSDFGADGAGALSIEVHSSGGQLIVRAGPGHPAGSGVHAAAAQVLAGRGRPGTIRATHSGSYLAITEPIHYRAHRIPYAYGAQDFALDVTSPAGTGSPGTLVVSLSLARIGQATSRLTAIALAVSGIVVLAAGCLAAWMLRALLRPLAQLRHRADAIAAGQPSAGGPGTGGPRSGADRVAPVLNATLTQCEHAPAPAAGPGLAELRVTEQRRAMADTAHQLRTPLSILSGLAEYYRHGEGLGPGDFDRLLDRVGNETARIGTLIDALGRSGQDPAGPPGPDENVGRHA